MKPSHDVKRQVSTERVEAGADVEAQAAARLRTAEDIAARGGHVDVVEVARTGELLSFSHTLSLSLALTRSDSVEQREEKPGSDLMDVFLHSAKYAASSSAANQTLSPSEQRINTSPFDAETF
jgi:hypothetical protein